MTILSPKARRTLVVMNVSIFRRGRRHNAPVAPDPARVSSAAGASPVVTVTDESFLELTEGGYTIVDFGAAWCGPCRSFAPVFHAAAGKHAGLVRFGTCDIDQNPRTAELLQIRSIPTLVVFGPDGSETGRSLGAVSRGDLEATIRQLDSLARNEQGDAGL